MNKMKRQLFRPENVRHSRPHVCAFCNMFRYDDAEHWECLRSDELPNISHAIGDGAQYETTCDLWRAAKHATEKNA